MALEGGGAASEMAAILDKQKQAHLRDGVPSAEVRIDRLDRAIGLLIDFQDEIEEALAKDFGHRSKDATRFTDVASSIGALKFAKKNVAKWMRPERRKTELPFFLGAKSQIQFQPKGVIGVISPWNFPVNLTFTPLAGVFAAGNRAMIKPSEFTEYTSELMERMFRQAYSEEEVAVVTGGPDVGAAFSSLAFDHLVFTGATSIAYHVMRAAADNLVPLTLELGGKSPVILGRSADMQKAAARIMNGKTLNAGQICLAPDYAFVPKEKTREFVEHATSAIDKMFGENGLKDNDDYTSVVNQRHYDRLQGYLEDARAKGADVVELNPKDENFSQQPHHKIPPTLVLNPTDDMDVMKDEIFGPILPVKDYSDVGDAVNYINQHDRPLGLYYFGEDAAEKDMVLNSTTSGGVTVNDVIFHVAQEDLPFGGIGPSGMGAYHGKDGFLEFSHKKSVYTQTSSEILSMMRPPYGEKFRKTVQGMIKR